MEAVDDVAKYVAMSNRLRVSELYLSVYESDGSNKAEEGNRVSEITLTSVNLKVIGDATAEGRNVVPFIKSTYMFSLSARCKGTCLFVGNMLDGYLYRLGQE